MHRSRLQRRHARFGRRKARERTARPLQSRSRRTRRGRRGRERRARFGEGRECRGRFGEGRGRRGTFGEGRSRFGSRPRPLTCGVRVLPGRSRTGLALPLFPAPNEGPPVSYGPAACLPAAGLAPVEEAPGVYAVAALPAVQLHFSEGRRPETVRHGLTQGCGIISRFRKGRTLHGFGAGLPGIREFRALLRPALRRQKLRQSRFGTLRKKARRERGAF